MTDEALVHFWPDHGDVASPCGTNVYRTLYAKGADTWSEVTCPECRLEQPMDTRGNPERGLAPEVSRRLLAERLAKIAAVEDEALEEIRHFTTLLKDALALRARLSVSLADLDAPVVPEEGAAPSTPQKSAERHVLITSGHRRGQYASFVGATRFASGRVDVCVRFPDEAMTRTYDSEYVEILPASLPAFRVRPGFETKDGHHYTSVPCEVPEAWHRLDNEGPDKLWASGPYLIRSYPYGASERRYHVSRNVDGRLTDFAIEDYHTIKAAKEICKINARGEQSFNWAYARRRRVVDMSNEMQLSESAKAALLAAPSFNQGALVSNLTFGVKAELHQEGMIGQNAGLTRKGSILTEKLKKARERELFGL